MAANCILGREQRAVQRRNDMKIRQNITISIETKDESGKEVTVEGVIKDISAGGILFTSDYPFEMDQILSFNFDKTDEPIHLECQVIRIQPFKIMVYGEEEEKTGYGCRFINLHNSTESVIRSYVFRQDLLMRRKK